MMLAANGSGYRARKKHACKSVSVQFLNEATRNTQMAPGDSFATRGSNAPDRSFPRVPPNRDRLPRREADPSATDRQSSDRAGLLRS
jgi:hypothetical protein